MGNLFKVDDLKKKNKPMIVLSGHGSNLSHFIFTPCSTQFTLPREKVQSGPNFQTCSAPSGPKSFNYLSVYLRTTCV